MQDSTRLYGIKFGEISSEDPAGSAANFHVTEGSQAETMGVGLIGSQSTSNFAKSHPNDLIHN